MSVAPGQEPHLMGLWICTPETAGAEERIHKARSPWTSHNNLSKGQYGEHHQGQWNCSLMVLTHTHRHTRIFVT